MCLKSLAKLLAKSAGTRRQEHSKNGNCGGNSRYKGCDDGGSGTFLCFEKMGDITQSKSRFESQPCHKVDSDVEERQQEQSMDDSWHFRRQVELTSG